MINPGEAEGLKCPECGATADAETNYCTNCGVDNRGRWEKAVNTDITIVEVCFACQQCGREYDDAAFKFCPDDGKQLFFKRKETRLEIKLPGSK
jgi:membrane protease subunit (stomatin/prohibitin family)